MKRKQIRFKYQGARERFAETEALQTNIERYTWGVRKGLVLPFDLSSASHESTLPSIMHLLYELRQNTSGRERVMAFKTQSIVFDIGLDRDYEDAGEYFEKNKRKFLESGGKYKILFVCKFNRYRSNVALALFNKYNKNQNVIAKASGVVQGPPVLEKMERVANEFGVSLNKKPKHLTEYDYSWADLVVTIGNDLPSIVFEHISGRPRKVISWELADVEQFDLDYYGKTMKLTAEIENRVKGLLRDLEGNDLNPQTWVRAG